MINSQAVEVGPNDAAFPEADARIVISCKPDDVILVCSILKYVLKIRLMPLWDGRWVSCRQHAKKGKTATFASFVQIASAF